MNRTSLTRSFHVIALATWLGLSASAPAALLVYEGYNYALSGGAAMHGVAATGSGLTGNYTVNTAFNGTGTGSVTYNSSGLSFGPTFFASSGGALNESVTGANSTNNASVASYVELALPFNPTGTLYTSYLFQFSSQNSNDGAGSGMTAYNGASYFQTAADAPFNSGAANRKPGAGYDGSINANFSGGSLSNGVTYLAVARYTNTGMALSGGSPGVATVWIFTQSQYQNWFDAGALEAQLSAFATGTASESVSSGTYTMASGNSLRFFNTSGTNGSSGTQALRMDEVRWGTSLSDVVVVPEPSGTLLAGLGALVAGLTRRKRRA